MVGGGCGISSTAKVKSSVSFQVAFLVTETSLGFIVFTLVTFFNKNGRLLLPWITQCQLDMLR